MKIELVSKNQLRITLDTYDLDRWDVDIDTLDYGSDETLSMIWNIMEKAHETTGFDPTDSLLIFEMVQCEDNTLTMIVTKRAHSLRDHNRTFREVIKSNTYVFNSIDLLIECVLRLHSYDQILSSSLYYLEGQYYLCLEISVITSSHFNNIKRINSQICEYIQNKTELNERFLLEHGKSLIRMEAIDTIKKYF